MNFEQELQALVDKYQIEEIEVSYKKKTTFRALQVGNPYPNVLEKQTQSNMDDPILNSVREELADPNLAKYLGGTTGTVQP